MDQPPAVAFTAFADVWPRATETEIGAALCHIGVGTTLNFFDRIEYGASPNALQSLNITIVFLVFQRSPPHLEN